MRFQWAKIDDDWIVVLVHNNGFTCFDGVLYKMDSVIEWGPICWPPRERVPVQYGFVEDSLGVVNAADYEDKKREGDVYIAPEFEITSQHDGDCAVVALANVLHLDYKSSKMIAFQHGWSSMGGLTEGFIELIIEKKEFKTFFRKDLTKGYIFEWESPEGTFLVYCKDHVMAARSGDKYPFNLQDCLHREISSVIEIRKDF